jgi:hypothetical protein
MLLTLTIASLVGCSVLGYYTAKYRKQAIDTKVKYEASVQFTNEAAARILKLESDNISLAETVRHLKTNLTLAEARNVVKPKVKAKAKTAPVPAPVMKAVPAKRGRKPKQD